MRLSEVDVAKSVQQFNAALVAGMTTSNAGNFVFKHLADAKQSKPVVRTGNEPGT